MSDWIEVEVPGWDRFNGRKDIKNPTWFRVEYRLLEDPDFYDFSHEEFKAWLYVLAQACRKNKALVRVNFDHAKAVSRINRAAILSAIEKLESLQLVHRHVTDTSRARHADVTDTIRDRTGQDRTEQNKEGQDTRSQATAVGLPPLAELWNEKANPGLARVRPSSKAGTRFKACAERWKENPNLEFWTQVIEQINASAFCLGDNERGWRADFDFLTRPDTHAKVLEGKYDGKGDGPVRIKTAEALVAEAEIAELAEWERRRKAEQWGERA